jgi:uncharacterized protein YyaL (SSP411 family)
MAHPAQSNRPPNRLANETSPYLLQHAYNPVDWHPWGEEAFEKARREDKPVFLSVGYSACHWCHVMERESFENEEIAALLNEKFVSIKVDREERPDVDQIYMTAVQLITQRGGWPMSVFLTPEGEPFYGGTYWPPTSRMGMPGFRDILLKLDEVWTHKRDDAVSSAAQLREAIGQYSAPEFASAALNEDVLRKAQRSLLSSADRVRGGFGEAPKFPHSMDIRVLLRCWERFGDADALDVAVTTLDRMASGGIYDHLGGGFHRYSTDANWLVPHFEKMLYDNALLVPAYVEAMQILRGFDEASRPRTIADFEQVVRQTLDYVLREMTQPEGGFYSTQDADSEGEEGKFFVWDESEVIDALGPEDGRAFCYAYDVSPRGNWEGKNILNRPKSTEQAAKMLGKAPHELEETLHRCRRKLLEVRSQRVAPGRDDKVLSGWNGLMISAMAMAGRVLNEPRYTEAAGRAADFLLNRMRDDGGRLLHSYKDGRARFMAYLDDYACLIDGLAELYQATFESGRLESAIELTRQMQERFSDPESGAFFYTADDHERLIARTRDSQDNATPSGNSMAATALLKLGRLTGRSDIEEAGYRVLEAMSGLLAEQPRAAGQAVVALDFQLGPTFEVAIVDGPDAAQGDALLAAVNERFLPRVVVARRPAKVADEALRAAVEPLFSGREAGKQGAAYVCERGVCQLPVSDAAGLLKALGHR